MKKFKKALALLLSLSLVLGMIPASALTAFGASGTPIDAALFFSDLHTSQNDYKDSLIKSVMGGVKKSGLNFSSVTSVGDAFSSNETTYTGDTSKITKSIQDGLGDATLPVFYAWSDHDRAAGIENYTGLMYGDVSDAKNYDVNAKYYIYSISMSDMTSSTRYGVASTFKTEKLAAFTATIEKLDHTKPLFIVSHQPLHARRSDNQYADEWYNVITVAAEKMDIAFFWGHNHSGETNVDRNAYYVAKDGSEKMAIEGMSTSVIPNFTYLNAGYIGNDIYGDEARAQVATAVAIYEDEINYTVYNANGVLTGTYALNETVEREFATANETPEGGDTPTVPDTDDPSRVVGEEITVGGDSYEEKTVYVKVDSFEDGEKYLLIGEDGPSNGAPIALVNSNGSDTTTPVTVKTDSITVDGVTYSDGYIELDNSNAVFTASGSSSNGYTLNNGNYYIGGTGATTLYNSSNNAVSVTYDANADRLRTASGTTRYLYYSTYGSETWKWSTSSSSSTSSRAMYIYKEVTAKIPTSEQITYTMQASDVEHILDTTVTGYTNTQKIDYALLANGNNATTLPSGENYKFEVTFDEQDIINGISDDGTITFNNVVGEATVRVSYIWSVGNKKYTVYKDIKVSTKEPYIALEITHDDDKNANTPNEIVKNTIAVKNVQSGMTYNLDAEAYKNGVEKIETSVGSITWASSNPDVATVDANGVVTFTGVEGAAQITATYTYGDNKTVTDTVKVSASKGAYVVPSDGTADFPEYPNEGAIRFDKTASAVGNFSQTGITQVELSMTGVPFTKGNTMDVVMMLDRSSSMTDTRIAATKEAAKVFVKNVVTNEDGTFNGNRIYVGDFIGGNPSYAGQSQHAFKITSMTTDESDGFQIINNKNELDDLLDTIDSTFVRQNTSYGTEYAQSLEYCYDLLNSVKSDGNKQFCVFMSDGIPNVYQYSETGKYTSTSEMAEMFSTTNNNTYNTRSSKYHYEYYSGLMKNNGVTVFTVGLGLENTNTAWSGVSATGCLNASSLMLNDISGPAGETTKDSGTTLSKKDKYFFSVADSNAATAMKDVFAGIASEILEAATDVIVTDKIADEYTMIFDVPTGTKKDDVAEALPDNQEFYIEVVSYALDANHERTTETILRRIYIDDQGAYYKDSSNNVVRYTEYNADSNPTGVTVSGSGQTLKIECQYFSYDASTRMLQWKADKLSTTELALRYFLYLDNSATEVGQPIEKDPGTYPTNDYANLTYTNHLGNRCYQEFPVPQMTWNGAQVTYLFYLVNAQGQPVNKSGQVVDFANAVFVTAPVTESVVWNEASEEGSKSLNVKVAAKDVLPGDYDIYDENASYEVHVYETETGALAGVNRFIISGSETTGTSTGSTTKVYNTKAGTKHSVYGTYTSKGVTDYTDVTVLDGFDFANTTVAFAVTWTTQLVEDAVVVDYGLPVNIDVLANDIVDASLNSISKTGYTSQALNTGVADKGFADVASITLDNGDTVTHKGNEIKYIQKDMEFDEESVFYYDANVNYYKDSNKLSGYIHSKVTVIPATTVYYEDNFVDFKVYDKVDGQWSENKDVAWSTDGTTADGVQATDRPGTGSLNDANNIYGYDSAYTNMSKYSLGSSRYLNVNANRYGTAEFSFYGTGFDVIGLTSNTTGTITVKVTKDVVSENGETTTETVKSLVVDTYYGYTYDESTGEWKVDPDAKNALYQVPVMEVEGLDYGKYDVTIKAAYNSLFDHQTANGNYDLYIDAIRIYDPANDGANSKVIENAYTKDGEGWPEYLEIRDNILDAATITSSSTEAELAGVVFIDGISETASFSDYANAGPNNEVYLAAGQAIAFNLGLDDTTVDKVHIGIKSATDVPVSYKIFDASTVESSNDVNAIDAKGMKTSTGMYYDITDLKNSTIVIYNSGDSGILSLTDVKVTHKTKPVEANPSAFYINGKVSQKLIESLNTTKVEEVYEMNVTVPTSVKEGSAAAVTVETSKNIEVVTVNGVAIEYYSEDASGTRVWNTNVVCETIGTKTIKVVGYNADGNIVAEKEATITVEKKSTTEKVIGALVTWIKNLFGWMSGNN